MRTEPYDPDNNAGTCVDWKADPYVVLQVVDNLLSKFGLEVVGYDMGSSDYCFDIQKKEQA